MSETEKAWQVTLRRAANKFLAKRISEARLIISQQAEKNAVGIPMIRASVFRCFLGVLSEDAGLPPSDLGAIEVWNHYLSETEGEMSDG